MRYIGSKENLLPFLESVVCANGIISGTFCDLFAGTTVVGRHFKRRGFRILSNDLMEYARIFGQAYLVNNTVPTFNGLDIPPLPRSTLLEIETERLEQVLAYLNALPPEPGFIWQHYSDEGTAHLPFQRMYFSAANAGKIDAIRSCIARWSQEGRLTENEHALLVAALLEAVPGVSNTSGTYGAYLKFWESRSQKPLMLTIPPLLCSQQMHQVSRCDANALVREVECDILYLDPPYNTRQYAPNYHLLETIARWDAPPLTGKSGLRPYAEERSAYCSRATALEALRDIVQQARCRLLLLSYNSEGILPHEALCEVLGECGPVVVEEQSYRRYRSDSDHAKRQYKPERNVLERLYILHREKEYAGGRREWQV